jgi:hypothetical protein
MHCTRPCTCDVRASGYAHELHAVDEILAGKLCPALTARELLVFDVTARWLDQYISRPDPAVGRSGDVCPWTRRTLQLGNLFLASVTETEPEAMNAHVLRLLAAFDSLAPQAGPLATFRAIVAVFPELSSQSAEQVIVASHSQLKPTFLRHQMMLGEFYPTCEKPGLHNPDFRPLRSDYPLLVIRAMVDADIAFLTDRDEFAEAYLDTFGARGAERILQLLEDSEGQLPPERAHALRRGAIRRLTLGAGSDTPNPLCMVRSGGCPRR